jgi:hypothetical protein
VGAVSTAELNNTRYVGPSESIQTAIDDLASQSNIGLGRDNDTGHVYLKSAAEYNEGSEIHVKPGITLDFNEAVLTHSADHNLVFLDRGSHLRNAQIEVDNSVLTSDVIVLDTSRADKYAIDSTAPSPGSEATATGSIIGFNDPTGQGNAALALRDDGELGITVGCSFDLEIFRCSNGILADVPDSDSDGTSGYINGVELDGTIHNCQQNIRHEGHSNGLFRSIYRGQLHPGFYTDYVVQNAAGDGTSSGSPQSIAVWGHMWDPGDANQNAIAGPNIHVLSRMRADLGAQSDGAAGQNHVNIEEGLLTLEDVSNDDYWRFASTANGFLKIQNPNASTNDNFVQFNANNAKMILPDGTTEIAVGTNGAVLRVNGSGEWEAVDESGNVTVIS